MRFAKIGKRTKVSAGPPMGVKLVAYPEDIERIIAFAAKSTYKGHEAEDYADLPRSYAEKMVPVFVASGHGSVLEHGLFTFDVRNVSRALTHQLVRHRVASYTQESQHYIDYGEITFVMPDKLTGDQQAIFKATFSNAFDCYRALIDAGYPSSEARGILPNSTASRIVVSMNARSLLNFFGLRCCHINTWEIRKLAWKMLIKCKKAAPKIFESVGPRCFEIGFCPEGKRCCKKYPDIPIHKYWETGAMLTDKKNKALDPENGDYDLSWRPRKE